MLKVAITGGMGAGKSSVRELLQAKGAYGIDADTVARRVVDPGTPGLRRVVEEFGADLLDGEGRLKRRELARRAFADSRSRERLEAILHPLIIAEETRLIERFEARDPDGVVVIEVPLLAEAGTAGLYDQVVLVTASDEVRRARLARARRFSPEDAEARIGHQARDEERAAHAQYTVRNDGDPFELASQVDRLWVALKAGSLRRRG